jgi:hypothetical protein
MDKRAAAMREAAKALILEQLAQHEDPGVRAMALLFGVPDDHPSIDRVAEMLATRGEHWRDA